MTIEEIQKEIIDEFSFFDDWQQRYEYIIELGKSLSLLNEEYKTDEYIIKGCQSKVWLNANLNNDRISYFADSDGILPKGIISLLLRVYNNQTPKDIINSNNDFINQIGLNEFLSPNRANGLNAMIKQIKYYALGFNK